ncbi:MAG TPA: tetratricopeptide repeat protein [Candidatus Angelobacter sp.]|nr:tetratricopeptide repeat protein [Candidatus Angelobacter sp.]
MKSIRRLFARLLLSALTGILSVPAASQTLAPASENRGQKMPVTTASPSAAQHFEAGMVNFENHRWNLALQDWREAVKLDPNFALAYAWICFDTSDPAEETIARNKARATMNSASAGEQLMIRWIIDVHENNYVEAIAAMNDLAAVYPGDKRVNFLVGYWLYRQDQYDLSRKFTQRALALDPAYATAYNQLGYLYSRSGDYDRALEALGKYVQLLPREPNPHDSYAEVLRLSGRYNEALEEYRTALRIDPTFYISQKELGETYSLMGDEERARVEYVKAVHDAPYSGVKAEYLQKLALTWVREKKFVQADKAYRDAADQAKAMQQWVWQARAYRLMAMYQPDSAIANQELDQAGQLLQSHKDDVDKVDFDEERARILRVRVERNLPASPKAPVSPAAQSALGELEKLTASGASVNIERTYHGASGAQLKAQQNYNLAIAHLEEDSINPLSMKLLVIAYRKTHAVAQAANMARTLMLWKIPSMEEVLTVQAFRAQETAVTAKK